LDIKITQLKRCNKAIKNKKIIKINMTSLVKYEYIFPNKHEIDLSSQEDLPIFKFKSWPIFMGDLSFLNFKKNFSKRLCFPEIDLFSWVTYPFWNSKNDLFSWATCPFQIKKKIQQVSLLPLNWSIFIDNLSILKFKSLPIFMGDLHFFKF